MKKASVLFLIMVMTLGACKETEASREEAPRIVNYINFLRQNDYRIELRQRDYRTNDDVTLLYEAAREEVALAREYGIPATFLLQYDALIDPAYQKLMKEELPEGCEVGAWWEITKPHYEAIGLEWPFEQVWYPYDVKDFGIGHTPQERCKLVDAYMEKFREVFGYYPRSVGSWYIDSFTLGYMYDKYHIVASCVCKEQVGTDGYTLWGGYWNQAFYPSRLNAHMPAQTVEGQIPVPVFRMLGSDPIYQYDAGSSTNGQFVHTMEPISTKTDRDWVGYYLDSFAGEPCLDYSYVQIGQENSFTWPRIKDGLIMQLQMIDSLRNEKNLKLWTLAQTGEWFKSKYSVTPPTAVTAMRDIRGEGHRTIWYDSRFYRVNLLWAEDGFRVRDIHKFDERVRSQYMDEAATGTQLRYYTLPVMDGYHWSSETDAAGLYILLEDGTKAVFGEPEIDEGSNGRMTIRCSDRKGHPFTIILDEDSISIMSSARWSLLLSAPRSELLPFKGIDGRSVSASFQDFPYSVTVSKGSFRTCAPYGILPENGEVSIRF